MNDEEVMRALLAGKTVLETVPSGTERFVRLHEGRIRARHFGARSFVPSGCVRLCEQSTLSIYEKPIDAMTLEELRDRWWPHLRHALYDQYGTAYIAESEAELLIALRAIAKSRAGEST